MEFYKYAVDRKIKPIKEVSTLVNEKLSPGIYETEWDASNYPSGVYFYKLTTGDFVETKKMLLIK
jgi:hypothetical protein